MSLSRSQQARTRKELQSNLALSGWTTTQFAAALGIDEGRLVAALAVDGAHPADVWLIRDAIDAVVRASDREPVPYTSMTEQNRSSAEGWFGIASPDAVRLAVLRASASGRAGQGLGAQAGADVVGEEGLPR